MEAENLFKEIVGILEPHYEIMPLNPPASEREISALENDLPFTLPEDFKAIYRLHNGEGPQHNSAHSSKKKRPNIGLWFFNRDKYIDQVNEYASWDFNKWFLGLFCSYDFLSLKGIHKEYHHWLDVHETWYIKNQWSDDDYLYSSIPPNTIKNVYVNTGWLPFATDGGGNCLAIDFSPDSNGVSGQIINFGRDDHEHYQIATSFTGFLEFVLEQYKLGNFHSKLSPDGDALYSGLAKIMK